MIVAEAKSSLRGCDVPPPPTDCVAVVESPARAKKGGLTFACLEGRAVATDATKAK
jgi:hypothetical protein